MFRKTSLTYIGKDGLVIILFVLYLVSSFLIYFYRNEKQRFVYDQMYFGLQHATAVSTQWNNYYSVSGFSEKFFHYIRSLFLENPSLTKVQLISTRNTILFDSNELIYGKYELPQTRMVTDTALVERLQKDSVAFDFITLVSSSEAEKDNQQYLEVLIPQMDPVIGRISTVRMVFTTAPLRKEMWIQSIKLIFLMIIFVYFLILIRIQRGKRYQKFVNYIQEQKEKYLRNLPTHLSDKLEWQDPYIEQIEPLLSSVMEDAYYCKQSFHLLFHRSPFPMFLMDSSGKITEYNEAFQRIFQLRKMRSSHISFFDLVSGTKVQELKSLLEKLDQNTMQTIVIEAATGDIFHFGFRIFQTRSGTQFYGIVLESESALSGAFTRNILLPVLDEMMNLTSQGVIICDRSGKIQFISGELIPTLIEDNINPIMENIFDVFPDFRKIQPSLLEVMQREKEYVYFDVEILRENDPVFLTGVAFIDQYKNTDSFAILIRRMPREYTGRKSKEFTVDQLIIQKILTQWSHFFAEILMPLQTLQHEFSGNNSVRTENLLPLIDRLVSTINNVYTRLKELVSVLQPSEFQQEPVSLPHLIQQVISQLYPYLQQKKLEILYQPLQEILVPIDEKFVKFIVRELLLNSIEALPAEGLPIQISTIIYPDSAQDSGHSVQITIRDLGTGIPTTIKDTIFEPFVTTRHNRPFAGLGLYLVRTIIQRYSGSIAVKSQESAGTTVYVNLPVVNPT